MKNIGDLTELEAVTLGKAQAQLREIALAFAINRTTNNIQDLYIAARRFSDACDSVGFQEYWKPDSQGTVHITPTPESGCCGHSIT